MPTNITIIGSAKDDVLSAVDNLLINQIYNGPIGSAASAKSIKDAAAADSQLQALLKTTAGVGGLTSILADNIKIIADYADKAGLANVASKIGGAASGTSLLANAGSIVLDLYAGKNVSKISDQMPPR